MFPGHGCPLQHPASGQGVVHHHPDAFGRELPVTSASFVFLFLLDIETQMLYRPLILQYVHGERTFSYFFPIAQKEHNAIKDIIKNPHY